MLQYCYDCGTLFPGILPNVVRRRCAECVIRQDSQRQQVTTIHWYK